MKPYTEMSGPELLDEADELITKLRARLLDVPADPDHHAEWFAIHAEDLASIGGLLLDRADEICAERLIDPPKLVDTYNVDRSIDDVMTRDPDPIRLFVKQAL